MSEKDVVITYETLFELSRLEKGREELQKISPSFFSEVIVYLEGKRRTFDSKEKPEFLFAADDKDKIRIELDNIKKILKDLYDRREKKIVSMALNKAKTGVMLINTANMLPSERMMFDSVNSTLFEFRRNTLFKLVCGETPDMTTLPDNVISKINSISPVQTANVQDDSQQAAMLEAEQAVSRTMSGSEDDDSDSISFRRLEEPKELKISPGLSDSSAASRKVRFLAPIEEIVGPDLQIYGPYDEGAIISLPSELARVLVEKRQVEEI